MTGNTPDTSCFSSVEESIKTKSAVVADYIGDTFSVTGFAKRLLQTEKVLLPEEGTPTGDQFNNYYTGIAAWVGSLCYLCVGLSLYLDKVKYARAENRFKSKLFVLTGLQCAALSTFDPGALALPSFTFCALVDFGTAIHSMVSAYQKTSFAGWLEDSLQELSNLKKLNLTDQADALEKTIQQRYNVNHSKPGTIRQITNIIRKFPTEETLFLKKFHPSIEDIQADKKIQTQLEEDFSTSIYNFYARTASFAAMILLNTVTLTAFLQPYAPLILLGGAAVRYGYRTCKALFFNSNNDKKPLSYSQNTKPLNDRGLSKKTA